MTSSVDGPLLQPPRRLSGPVNPTFRRSIFVASKSTRELSITARLRAISARKACTF